MLNVNEWADKVRVQWPTARIQAGAGEGGARTMNACTSQFLVGKWTERGECWIARADEWATVETHAAAFYSVAADLS